MRGHVPIREVVEGRQLRIPLGAVESFRGRRFEELRVGTDYEIIDFSSVPPSIVQFSEPIKERWVAERLANVLNCGVLVFTHGMETSGLHDQFLRGVSELPMKLRMDALEMTSQFKPMNHSYQQVAIVDF